MKIIRSLQIPGLDLQNTNRRIRSIDYSGSWGGNMFRVNVITEEENFICLEMRFVQTSLSVFKWEKVWFVKIFQLGPV